MEEKPKWIRQKGKKTYIYLLSEQNQHTCTTLQHGNASVHFSWVVGLLRQQEVNDNYWTGVPCSDTQSNLERVYIHKSMTRCLIQSVISAKILLQHHLIKRHNLKNSLCIAWYVSSWYSCWQKSPTPFTLTKPIFGNRIRLSLVHSLGEQEDGENETTCKSISTSI